jgi:hypothetical protein
MKIEWVQFRDFCDNRSVDMLMIETSSYYHLFAADENVRIECDIDKNPSDDTDLVEFETDYKESCNPDKYNKDEMIAWGKLRFTLSGADFDEDNPKIVDIKFPDDTGVYFYNFFGSWVHVEGHGENDYMLFQLVDKDNVLGYGTEVVLKEYCELWCKHIEKTTVPIYAPKDSAGNVPAGLYARMIYFPTDPTKTNIKFWGKLVATVNT